MRNGFRQSMAWLHTWVGLLLGWVLYFMFITGTVGYLDTEIDRWMMPEAPVADLTIPPEPTLNKARHYLEVHAPRAQRWLISLPVDRNSPYPRVFWSGAQGEGIEETGSQLLDPTTGAALETRDTSGGQTLYSMHWRLHYLPRGPSDLIIGVATMFMLVALITGIIVHKKIFKDFFTFRPGKGQRSWLDAHNLVSVLSLPFQVMITYSGLIFMMFIYMPLVVAAWYGPGQDNRQVFFDEVFSPGAAIDARGEPAPLTALGDVVSAAQQRWEDAPIASVDIRHPQDANARIIVRGNFAAGPLRAADTLTFDGVTGERLSEQPALGSGGKAFRDVTVGLHEGLFAGPVLRVLYVVSGLLGSAMVATGLVFWSVRRRQRIEKARQVPHPGLRLVEKLNVATVAGLPVAIAAYFWANRLLPLDIANRAEWEVHSLFLTWLVLLGHAVLRPATRAWFEQLTLAAFAFGLLPLLNFISTDRHLGQSLATGDWVFAGFDLTALAVGLVLGWIAWRVLKKLQGPSARTLKAASPARQALYGEQL